MALAGVEGDDLERVKDRAARERTRQAGRGLVRAGEPGLGMRAPCRGQPQRESGVSPRGRVGAA